MAATIVKENWLGNRLYLKNTVFITGTGAPAASDVIVTNTRRYPVGSSYLDTAGSKIWFRVAAAGVAADWKGVAVA